MEEDLSERDYNSLHEFRYAIRRYLRFSEETARAAGVEPQQQQLMLAIKGMATHGGDARIGDLAESLQIRHHSAVELIDRLVARGFAVRQRSEADRRQVHVRLTPEGEQKLREVSSRNRDELRNAGAALVAVLDEIIQASPPEAAPEVRQPEASHSR
jgi:DNA-binding MarR family transcriptional regulator